MKKMHNQDLILGIDTSNYTTSLSITNGEGEIIVDSRKPLMVKQGERGLRQSHALFQHMENLPDMILELFSQVDKSHIKAVAVSERPRPLEDSYMPVFRGGINYGKILAASLGVPFFPFSHQEGHIEAIKHGGPLDQAKVFLACHLSGGTCEILKVSMLDNAYDQIEIIGGSKDISFGQLIDRVGVAMGLSFPAGKQLDQLTLEYERRSLQCNEQTASLKNTLSKIALDDLLINLSGIETQCHRNIDSASLPWDLFTRIAECLCMLAERAMENTGIYEMIFAGGVSSSEFIKKKLEGHFKEKKAVLAFGNAQLASDNAVGISLLGGKALWQSSL